MYSVIKELFFSIINDIKIVYFCYSIVAFNIECI